MRKEIAMEIEKNYKGYLIELKKRQVTAQSLHSDPDEYEKAAQNTVDYLTNLVLLSYNNMSLIRACPEYEFGMFVNDCTMQLLSKMDLILAKSDEILIPYVVTIVNHAVVNLYRKHKLRVPAPDPHSDSKVVHLDPEIWSLIPDVLTDVEEEVLKNDSAGANREMALQVLKNSNACTRFEMVCLLATKVLTGSDGRPAKVRDLAKAIDSLGLISVSELIFDACCKDFGISGDKFFNQFLNDDTPEYSSDIKELSAKISRASYRAAEKLCRRSVENHTRQ